MFKNMTTEGRVICTIGLYILWIITCCTILFFGLRIAGIIEAKNIKDDIFQLVLEQHDTLDQTDGKRIFCDSIGLSITGICYGYYYDADNTMPWGEPRGNGVKRPLGSNPLDWEYMERICDNWFYYEEFTS